jgi:signal transduction histidine kinase
VELDVGVEERFPPHVEVAAYYTVSEALTNAAKYADAVSVRVSIRVEHHALVCRSGMTGSAEPTRNAVRA